MRTLLLLFVLILPAPLSAFQEKSEDAPHLPEIVDIEFSGNETFDGDKLGDVIQSKESPGGFSKFLYSTLGEKFGAKPEYFDAATFEDDKLALVGFYRSQGFFQTIIEGDTVLNEDQNVEIHFTIHEHERSLIDSVIFRGLTPLPKDLLERIYSDPQIQKGDPYVEAKATAEINRVVNLLIDHGYPTARFDREHSTAEHHASTNNFVLTFTFITGREYQFGKTTVNVDPPREDITDYLALRHLDYQEGDVFSREKRISSESNLNRLGIFESARIVTPAIVDSGGPTAVPVQVNVRPRPLNEVSPEIIVSDENNAFNIGLGIGYTNHNFFGDARTFNTRLRARTQSIREIFSGKNLHRDPDVIGAIDLQFQVLQPYLFTRALSGSWTSTIGVDKPIPGQYLLTILRNKMGLSNQFNRQTFGFLDWSLERVSPEILVDSANVFNPIREEDQPQFNSIITLTLQQDLTNDIFSPTEGSFRSMSLEESGVLPKLLPGIRSGLPFTQYYKITMFGRWYHDLTTSRYNILGLKLKTGYQSKYGESRNTDVKIPLNRRFFSGGSGSVRGWKARDLGAMANDVIQFGGNFVLEASAEMRINYFRGFGKLAFLRLDNIWLVYFLDAGNVWGEVEDFRLRDIALAAGFGFRYETFFGPFRIDYGIRLYDPKAEETQQSIFQRRFFADVLGSGVFHFGIGHAF